MEATTEIYIWSKNEENKFLYTAPMAIPTMQPLHIRVTGHFWEGQKDYKSKKARTVLLDGVL